MTTKTIRRLAPLLTRLVCCAAGLPGLAARAELKTDIEFAKAGNVSLTLDAFVPEGKGPFPTCLLVHGGGFTKGDKQTFIKPLFEPLSQAGFTWFTINYRLAPTHRYPACVEDVEAAIRWVKQHAREYKADPDRIALIGESAGGHIVSLVGVRGQGETRVAAVVPFYAPHDLELQVKARNELGPSMTALFGLTELNDSAWKVLRDASSTSYLRKGLPPYLLIHGTKDTQVPYEQSVQFTAKMKALGNTCDFITIQDGAHGMGGWAKLGSDYQEQMIAWLKKTLAATGATGGSAADTRPPGGDGEQFYRVFLSQNDANGDGVVTKSEFRGSAARFDALDMNHDGKLDRAEIGELHKSRMADPLSMRQRLENGQLRQPPAGVRPAGMGTGAASRTNSPGGSAGATTATGPGKGEPFTIAPNGRQITGKEAFERLDVNLDGKVTAEEFRSSPGMSDEATAQATVAKVDKDADGMLSLEEFLTVFNQRHAIKTKDAPATPPQRP